MLVFCLFYPYALDNEDARWDSSWAIRLLEHQGFHAQIWFLPRLFKLPTRPVLLWTLTATQGYRYSVSSSTRACTSMNCISNTVVSNVTPWRVSVTVIHCAMFNGLGVLRMFRPRIASQQLTVATWKLNISVTSEPTWTHEKVVFAKI